MSVAAVGGYLAVSGGFSLMPAFVVVGCLGLSTPGLMVACRMADRIPIAVPDHAVAGVGAGHPDRRSRWPAWCW